MSCLVCFAVREEARPFTAKIGDNPDIRILVTGMGPSNAGTALNRELGSQPTLPEFVLACGFAGGLSPELPFGSVIYSADDGFPLLSKLEAAAATSTEIRSTDRVLTTVDEKAAFRESTGADAVDMESEVIRRICAERGIPSATVRVISDAWDEAMPVDFNRFVDARCNLQIPRLIAHVLTHPAIIPSMIRFRRRTAQAAESLAQTLQSIIAFPAPQQPT